MQRLSKNRLSAILLCLTVGLSSGGLPVVVVWCGMGADVMMESCNRQTLVSSAMSCCDPVTGTNTGTPKFKRIPCKPEFLFVVASTISSLPAKTFTEHSVLEVLFVLPAIDHAGVAGNIEHRVLADSPPLLRDNIPILISSLLI